MKGYVVVSVPGAEQERGVDAEDERLILSKRLEKERGKSVLLYPVVA